MNISELFRSIQGESTYSGLPCFFIRLAQCNLRCRYCDTVYAYDDGTDMTISEIMREVRETGISLVEVTGGEPLLQHETGELIDRLVDEDYKVLVETNGSLDIGDLNENAVIIMDMKTPSSGMTDKMNFSNMDSLKPSDEVKFVMGGRQDYEWSVQTVRDYSLTERCTVLFSPVYGVLDPSLLVGWILEDSLNVRVNLQIHKYIFGEGMTGV